MRKRKTILLGAAIAAIATAVVGFVAFLGVPRIPIAEYLLWPGSMAAWLYKGDNYRSGHEFIVHAVVMGVPLSALAGAVVGALVVLVRKVTRRGLE